MSAAKVITTGDITRLICKPCPNCGRIIELTLPTNAVRRWERGAKVQDVFPRLTPIQRESLISGVCSDECWNNIWETGE